MKGTSWYSLLLFLAETVCQIKYVLAADGNTHFHQTCKIYPGAVERQNADPPSSTHDFSIRFLFKL